MRIIKGNREADGGDGSETLIIFCSLLHYILYYTDCLLRVKGQDGDSHFIVYS